LTPAAARQSLFGVRRNGRATVAGNQPPASDPKMKELERYSYSTFAGSLPALQVAIALKD
jgi:hypothetical protein